MVRGCCFIRIVLLYHRRCDKLFLIISIQRTKVYLGWSPGHKQLCFGRVYHMIYSEPVRNVTFVTRMHQLRQPNPRSTEVPHPLLLNRYLPIFFQFAGHHYLVIGDRLSGWSEIYSAPSGTEYSGAKGLVQCLRLFFRTFGVPDEIASDGGPEFTAETTKRFLAQWDIHHRLSSAYYPQSNGRAEVAVKSAKRLLRTNVGPTGSLNTDKFLRAILQLRNTPDPDCKVSPAEIIFGRPLRDAFAFCNRKETFSNPQVQSHWKDAWTLKERALRKRFVRWSERQNERTRSLHPLNVGDRCFLQNQIGPHPKRWDRSGLIVEVLPYNKYLVKVDGSGRLTSRNRRYLRLLKNVSVSIPGLSEDICARGSAPRWNDPQPTTLPEQMNDVDRQVNPVRQDFNDVDAKEVGSTIPESSMDTDSIRNSTMAPEMPEMKLALRRLQPFNTPGLQDTDVIMPTRLRPRKTLGG